MPSKPHGPNRRIIKSRENFPSINNLRLTDLQPYLKSVPRNRTGFFAAKAHPAAPSAEPSHRSSKSTPKERDAMQTSSPTAAPIESPVPAGRRTARRRLAVVGLAAVAAAAVLAFGACSRPADPVEPLVLQKVDRVASLDAAPSLRIATFNIHAGVGRDGIRDLNRTAAALADIDLAALQEVRNPLLDFRGPQVSEIANKMGMAWLFVPAEKRWWRNDYGTGLVTRVALSDCVRIPLPTPSRQRFRAAFLANFPYRGRTVHLLAVHIDKDMEQNTHDNQLRTICDLFLSLQEPAILMGDLNEFGSHPEIARLIGTPGVHNALAGIPRPRVKSDPIDWIFTRGFRTIHAEWRVNPASDHPVACAQLEFSEGSGGPAPAVHTASLQRD
jgi:endonuclease/exonuclease/phosphatase family metal-dependent hydrolase